MQFLVAFEALKCGALMYRKEWEDKGIDLKIRMCDYNSNQKDNMARMLVTSESKMGFTRFCLYNGRVIKIEDLFVTDLAASDWFVSWDSVICDINDIHYTRSGYLRLSIYTQLLNLREWKDYYELLDKTDELFRVLTNILTLKQIDTICNAIKSKTDNINCEVNNYD